MEHGYATVVANTDEDRRLQAQVVATMIGHGVTAIVISPTYGAEETTFDPLLRVGAAVMQVRHKVELRVVVFPFAAPDYRLGGELAARHLVERGPRQIAFVGGPEGRAVTVERMAGCLSCLGAQGLPTLALHGRSRRAFGRAAARRLVLDHLQVDAAICFNDLVALGMLSGFAEMGPVVGQDFRLAGFDDIEECAQAYPSLTAVHCDIAGFGQWVAQIIPGWLKDGILPPPQLQTAVRLAVRASSGGMT